MSDECQSGHATVRVCSEVPKYLLYSCRRNGRPLRVCANAIEAPEKGTAARYQLHVDEHTICSACGREIRYCWSWIPI